MRRLSDRDVVITLTAVFVAIFFFQKQQNPSKAVDQAHLQIQSAQSEVEPAKRNDLIDLKTMPRLKGTEEKNSLPKQAREELHSVILLNGGNFESFVLRCFQGEPCKFSEDPMKLYEEFKISGNRRANDYLISFLRKQLKDPLLRDQYKDHLLKMITDFYSAEERPFQEAAYYNYLGDLQKSLDLYLDLEKKSRNNPSLRPAPKLNIANTYYDLGRPQDALPYYQSALDEYLSGQEQVMVPSTNDMIRFIEGRVGEIKTKASF